VVSGLALDGISSAPPSAHTGAAKANSASIVIHDKQTCFIVFLLRPSGVKEICRRIIYGVKYAARCPDSY
jgi:hypothetical protein